MHTYSYQHVYPRIAQALDLLYLGAYVVVGEYFMVQKRTINAVQEIPDQQYKNKLNRRNVNVEITRIVQRVRHS